jgi:hypothetical protein
MSTLNSEFLFWLEAQVYDSSWQLDVDLLEFLLGDAQ